MTAVSTRRWTGRHVLAAFVLFFGIVFAVNGVMIWFAVDSWPGLTSRQTYRDDARHSEAQAARAMDEVLGWTVAVDVKRSGGGGQSIVIAVAGRSGGLPSNFRPQAVLRRPVSEKMDRKLDLEPMGDGRWRARIDPAAAGNWVIRITAQTPSGAEWKRDLALWLE